MTGRHRLGDPPRLPGQHRVPDSHNVRKAVVTCALTVVGFAAFVAVEPAAVHEPAPLLATPPAAPAPAVPADPDTPMTDPPLLTPAPTVIHHHTRPGPLPMPASVTEQVSAPTAAPTVSPATEQPVPITQQPEPVQTVQPPTYTAWTPTTYPTYRRYYPAQSTRRHHHTHRSEDD